MVHLILYLTYKGYFFIHRYKKAFTRRFTFTFGESLRILLQSSQFHTEEYHELSDIKCQTSINEFKKAGEKKESNNGHRTTHEIHKSHRNNYKTVSTWHICQPYKVLCAIQITKTALETLISIISCQVLLNFVYSMLN